MDFLGVTHIAFSLLSMILGLVIFTVRKGTQLHRLLGYGYVLCMTGLNVTALMIYRLIGTFGPFHGLALVSLGTVAAGLLTVVLRRPRKRWLLYHYWFMGFSYVGLLMAAVAEVTTRSPFIRGLGLGFWVTTILSSQLVGLVGGYLVYKYQFRVLPRIASGKEALGKNR
jgi:uncharacterized membrane protein